MRVRMRALPGRPGVRRRRRRVSVTPHACDGETVTLRLMTLRPGTWKSEDDFYRLAARWNGSMLEYRPPCGDWTELAAFNDDHFEDVGSGVRRVFGRIGEDEVADWNRAIVTPREQHDYSIRPTDGPGRQV